MREKVESLWFTYMEIYALEWIKKYTQKISRVLANPECN
jgi:hypothetical protein